MTLDKKISKESPLQGCNFWNALIENKREKALTCFGDLDAFVEAENQLTCYYLEIWTERSINSSIYKGLESEKMFGIVLTHESENYDWKVIQEYFQSNCWSSNPWEI